MFPRTIPIQPYPGLQSMNWMHYCEQCYTVSQRNFTQLIHSAHDSSVLHAASLSLATFNPESRDIRDALMRMACDAADTDAGRGFKYALYAFSSLHRGRQQEALQFKIRSLRALSASSQRLSETTITTASAMYHVAACMLLCSFEVSQKVTLYKPWLGLNAFLDSCSTRLLRRMAVVYIRGFEHHPRGSIQ